MVTQRHVVPVNPRVHLPQVRRWDRRRPWPSRATVGGPHWATAQVEPISPPGPCSGCAAANRRTDGPSPPQEPNGRKATKRRTVREEHEATRRGLAGIQPAGYSQRGSSLAGVVTCKRTPTPPPLSAPLCPASSPVRVEIPEPTR